MEAVRDIGEIIYEGLKLEDKLLEIFTEDFSKGTKYNKIIEIVVSNKEKELHFNKVNLREYDDSLKYRYLYRSGSSNGTDITPTAKITEPTKTYNKKIVAAIKEGIDYTKKDQQSEDTIKEIEILDSLYNLLKDNKEIISLIDKKFNEVPKKERQFILTFVIEGGEEKYVGDFEVFKKRIREVPIEKFYYSKTNNKYSKSEDDICCICHKKGEVYGLTSPFAFYTIDKPGYISNGFNYEQSWKNYPVCKDCGIKMELGKSYLDQNLKLSFYGRNFYLIPKLIYKKNLKDTLNRYSKAFRVDENKSSNKLLSQESNAENRIMRVLAKEENSIAFDLMFIEENNAALNILLNIEDVHPSTLNKLYKTWDDMGDMKFFKEYPYLTNFIYLSLLFDSKNYNRYFLDVVDKIIGQGKIEYKFLIQFINEKLKESFVREEKGEMVKGEDNYHTATIRAYTFIYYLYLIDKFKDKGKEGVKPMVRDIWNKEDFATKTDAFEDYFSCNKAFFNNDSKKAVFMLGYLGKKLINLQSTQEGGRKPFMNQLNGLNLNKRDILRLLPKIQGKFIEYKKEYYNEEISLASEYLISSNQLNDLCNLDIPFYFSLGMNMVKKFDLTTKEEEQENDKE